MDVINFRDPNPINWAQTELPTAWPDKLELSRFKDLCTFLRKVAGKNIGRVQLPEGLPNQIELPKYLLQEFHNLPNGNYSDKISRGYMTGFDKTMLGKMSKARTKLAADLSQCRSALDVGSGGGYMTAALDEAGIPDVWGIEPSLYLLRHAAKDNPHLKFSQGLAEKTGFSDKRFEGISVSFVFHEIPPKYTQLALQEFNRILVMGGIVSIVEPDPEQLYGNYLTMLRKYGFYGLYFRFLAKLVHEPFIHAWHNTNYQRWAEESGFIVEEDRHEMPVRYFKLRKVATPIKQ